MVGKKKMLFILGVIVILLFGAAAVLLSAENSDNIENETEASKEGQTIELVAMEETEVDFIEITNQNGNYTISRAEDGTWTVDMVKAYELSQSMMESAVKILSSVSGQVIYDEMYDEAQFGVEKPAAQMRIGSGETEQVLYLGDYNEAASAWYVKTGEENRLYTIASGKGDWLLYSPYKYVDTTLITDFHSGTDNMLERLSLIRIERPDLETAIEIAADEKLAEDYTSSYWLTSPVHVKTSLKVMNNQIAGMFGFAADAVLGVYEKTDAAVYGMDEPAMVMTVEHDGIIETFTVGAQNENGKRYMTISENNLLYEISESKLSFLNATADDLFFEMALLPPIADVVEVILEFREESYVFELTHGEMTDDLTVLVDKQELDPDLFRKFYSFLLEIDIENLNGKEPSGDSIMCITYKYADGTQDSMEAFSMEENARRMTISVNGEPSFEGRNAYVGKVKTELTHLLSGEEIDTNW